MMKLTEHFTLEELLASKKAEQLNLANIPTMEVLRNIQQLANGLEEVRQLLGKRMDISSGYRCPALNRAVNGAKASAHMDGYAADFTASRFGTPLQIVKAIEASDIKFDKCICENTWVHISFAPQMRRILLTAHFDSAGKPTYTVGV